MKNVRQRRHVVPSEITEPLVEYDDHVPCRKCSGLRRKTARVKGQNLTSYCLVCRRAVFRRATSRHDGYSNPPIEEKAVDTDRERFDRYAPVSGPEDCWEWTGVRNRKGYGQTTKGSKGRRAHRLSYELHKGPIPAGQIVRHTCDNPPCVNPAHLLAGTHQENYQDAVSRGRQRWQKNHG